VTAEATIWKTIDAPSQKFLFPDMYNKTSVNQLQGAISGILQGFFGGSVEPYIFNAHYPFQVQILSYVYMYANGTAITYSTGIPYFPPGEDYELADKVKVLYQVTLQNTPSLSQAETFLNENLNSTTFGFYLSVVYSGLKYADYPVTVAIAKPTTWFDAMPLELPPNSAFSILKSHPTTLVLGLIMTTFSTLWLSLLF